MKILLSGLVALSLFTAVFCFFFLQPTPDLPHGTVITKILVEKSKRHMSVFKGDTLLKTYHISLGNTPTGAKMQEGDGKTPEGMYIIDDKNEHSDYHKNLGVSYPSEADKSRAASMHVPPGGDIKIHGLPNGKHWMGRLHLFTDWTAGCIAVTDPEIDELFELVKVGTPIEIRP